MLKHDESLILERKHMRLLVQVLRQRLEESEARIAEIDKELEVL